MSQYFLDFYLKTKISTWNDGTDKSNVFELGPSRTETDTGPFRDFWGDQSLCHPRHGERCWTVGCVTSLRLFLIRIWEIHTCLLLVRGLHKMLVSPITPPPNDLSSIETYNFCCWFFHLEESFFPVVYWFPRGRPARTELIDREKGVGVVSRKSNRFLFVYFCLVRYTKKEVAGFCKTVLQTLCGNLSTWRLTTETAFRTPFPSRRRVLGSGRYLALEFVRKKKRMAFRR